ncbi:ABC transporter ATP-binding protein [Aerococcus urinaeequi]|uniref:ABC transporter ATP-binding protein n=1 Tax=Aerococcus urinaeequi TaxID=51665 RepID=UPI000845D1C2|nr:ABC transporter ATP-binding protein [Aerococcus urinaeequi]
MSNKTGNILEVKDLEINFKTYSGDVQAIRKVNFDLKHGETLAIVGESGSGKSVTVRTVMRLLANNADVKGGQILFNGEDLLKKSEKEMQGIRGKDIAMIFQDPMTSLNPTMKIGKQIAEPIILHQNKSKKEAYARAEELLELVGIPKAHERMDHYPHQFSGGQRQRIVIAIALACNPRVLIADEPTTALDVTIQAQILELMKELQDKIDTSIIFITHDLGVVANVADRVAVMYAGKIVEYGDVDEIFFNPQHPYTWGLIGSMPTLDTADKLVSIPGTPPDLLDPPKGDAFALRSEYAMEIDYEDEPPLFQVSPTHAAATWLLHPDAPAVEEPAEIQRRHKIYESLSKGIVPEGYNDGAPQAELDNRTAVVTSADTEGVIATSGVDMEGDDAIG